MYTQIQNAKYEKKKKKTHTHLQHIRTHLWLIFNRVKYPVNVQPDDYDFSLKIISFLQLRQQNNNDKAPGWKKIKSAVAMAAATAPTAASSPPIPW